MHKWLIPVLAVLVAGCKEDVSLLTGQQLASELGVSRKIAFERFHYSGTAQFHPDATFEALVPRLGRDTGTWWLDGDRICSRWKNFRNGQELCAVVGQTEDGSYRGLSPKSKAFLGEFRFLD